MLLVVLVSLVPTVLSQDKLVLSQVVFRHGARAPTWNFTSTESAAYFYKGLGELTDEGVQQAYELGRALRTRLIDSTNLLDKRYIPSQSSFRSSALSRCILTASSVGAAIFDPVNQSIPNTVPVLAASPTDDYLCVPQNTPKIVSELITAAGAQPSSNSNLADLMNILFTSWRQNSTNFKTVGSLQDFDGLAVEKAAKLPLPSWYTDAAAVEADHYTEQYNEFLTGTGRYNNTEFVRCRSGLLLYTLMNNMISRSNCTRCLPQRFNAFATHDYMIMTLLSSFGILDQALQGQIVPFTAAILLELWQPANNGSMYVKLLFRRPGGQFTPLTAYIPGCGQENCPIANFTSCCGQYISANIKTECNYPSAAPTLPLPYIVILLAIFCII